MTRRDDARTPQAAPLTLVPAPPAGTEARLDPERVAVARERIERRYYDRADVRRALVEALLVEFAAP